MAVVFFVIAAMAAIYSVIRYQSVYSRVRDLLPPKFQDDSLTSRYAFPVYALDPATPLSLQASYMQSLWGGCVCFLCISLGFFAAGNVVFGCFLLLGLLWSVISAIKSWKTYNENRDRAMNQQDREQL